MNHVHKLIGATGIAVLCAVGLGSTAQAATVHPQVNVQTYIGNYPDRQSCIDAASDVQLYNGATSAGCWVQPDGTYNLYATFD